MSGVFRARCKTEGCSWDFEHRLKRFVVEAAENHEALMRTHSDDHSTTLPRYVDTETDRDGDRDD